MVQRTPAAFVPSDADSAWLTGASRGLPAGEQKRIVPRGQSRRTAALAWSTLVHVVTLLALVFLVPAARHTHPVPEEPSVALLFAVPAADPQPVVVDVPPAPPLPVEPVVPVDEPPSPPAAQAALLPSPVQPGPAEDVYRSARMAPPTQRQQASKSTIHRMPPKQPSAVALARVTEPADRQAVAVAFAKPAAAEPIVPPRPVAGMETNRAPSYPEIARRRGEQGRVMLRVTVSAEGTPLEVDVSATSGYPMLDSAALSAVRQWRFVPATQAGAPVSAAAEVPIRFRLED